MTTPILLLLHYFGRSFLIPVSTLEAVSQSKSDGVLTPADESVFPSWISNEVSYGTTPVCDLPIRDLTSSSLADF